MQPHKVPGERQVTLTTKVRTNGRHITTREAVVRTAAITIKSLSIDRKQVTLAVFRQLDNEDIIDRSVGLSISADGELQASKPTLGGVPWGRVNYCPGKGLCYGRDVDKAHFHVVWQAGDELRRATVMFTADTALLGGVARSSATLWLYATGVLPDATPETIEAAGFHPGRATQYLAADTSPSREKSWSTTPLVGTGDWTGITVGIGHPWNYTTLRNRDLLAIADRDAIPAALLKSPDKLQRLARQAVDAQCCFETEYSSLVSSLQQLDLLFIAV